MPCRDYYSDDAPQNTAELRELKKRLDVVTRIACKAMTELTKNGVQDFLLLKDDETRNWWKKHQEADAAERKRVAEKRRLAKLKRDALSKLNSEERKLLGL